MVRTKNESKSAGAGLVPAPADGEKLLVENSNEAIGKRGLIKPLKPIWPKGLKLNAQVEPDVYEHLKAVKTEVQAMERDNTRQIIVFDSGEPWYKTAYNSCLIYEYFIVPHLEEVHFHVRADKDRYCFSKTGVVGIYDLISFADELRQMGAKLPECLKKYFDGTLPKGTRLRKEDRQKIYVFEFKTLSKEKFNTFVKAKFKRLEELNKLVLPNYLPQQLYPDLHSLAAEVAKMVVNTLEPAAKSVYGERMMSLTIDALRDINAVCNGYGEGMESYKHALNLNLFRLAELQEIIRTLYDIKQIKIGSCNMILALSLRIQQEAIVELQKIEKDNSSEVVKAIKEAKSFPKVMGVDLSEFLPKAPEENTPGMVRPVRPSLDGGEVEESEKSAAAPVTKKETGTKAIKKDDKADDTGEGRKK